MRVSPQVRFQGWNELRSSALPRFWHFFVIIMSNLNGVCLHLGQMRDRNNKRMTKSPVRLHFPYFSQLEVRRDTVKCRNLRDCTLAALTMAQNIYTPALERDENSDVTSKPALDNLHDRRSYPRPWRRNGCWADGSDRNSCGRDGLGQVSKAPLVKPSLGQRDETKRTRKALLFGVCLKPMATQSLVDAAQAALDSR